MSNSSVRYNKIGFLSNSTIKIIACIAMLIDHIGFFLFPEILLFRIIGRLAFPLFAFLIAEGCKYSKNKSRHLALIFIFGVFFALFYLVYDHKIYLNVFLTFSFSISLIYLLQWLKKWTFVQFKVLKALISVFIFAAALAITYILFSFIHFEYGYKGMLVPIAVSLCDTRGVDAPDILKKLDNHWIKLLCFSVALLLLSVNANFGKYQLYCLISVIILMFYNGKVGNKNLKYVFYIFYPLHIAILALISFLISYFA
jgi:hypothetical protein